MTDDQELKINARGLSAPGPRLMVEMALTKGQYRQLRVVVSDLEAAEDLERFLSDKKCNVKTDQVGEEFHVLVDFEE